MANLTNEQRQRLGALIARKRDLRNEQVKVDNEIDAEILQLLGEPFTKEEPKTEKTAVPEKTFDLTYVKRTGAKIGEFEIADEKDSPKDLYERALSILKQNGATISKRYHGDGYVYAYWEYQNKIWRQKLKK